MSKIPIEDIDDVLFNPMRYFNSPIDVLDCDELEKDQKIALLFNWEWDVKLEEVALEENMLSDAIDKLPEIKKALKALGITSDVHHTSTDKFGGI